MVVVAWWGCCFLLRLPALLCCEAMVWALSFLVFPLRMLTAVDDREKKLGLLVWEMQTQMEDLMLENRCLQQKLRAALSERDAAEALLDEMEEEHDDAFATIHVLENQLKALRQENMRLNEHKGKAMWDKPGVCDKNPGKTPLAVVAFGGARGEEDAAEQAEAEPVLKMTYAADPTSVLALAAASPPSTATAAADDDDEATLARAVARRRSLFSLGMSLAVGAVAWSADAPCLPLLAGLFAVVAVSMRSVSRLRRGSGPAADAVALLSLNWFLLGVLTSPMLPGVAHAVVPRAGRVLGPALTWIAAAAPL
ncbi:uncharacterized protein LOC120645834 [Panicum virgatum]|uniref:Uncharacterized protein n=1 Tax=Panicum virgatum TaxID=38727 RepID=A0A8T0PQE9_PANVG|nr:uncharacterized protein LOC120645834 [Panicum virgatum]KAG2563305.1 hypothetical protein PVAP13_8KG328100 [Panicum virgatum]